jgi:hypothetical protein
MLHACLYTICFVFYYTSWHFYAFSKTNLLTRCHSASSLFLLFLCFRKATQEIFSEFDETKAQPSIFTEALRRLKMRQRGARSRPHPRVARPRPGLRHQGVSRPGPPSDAALSPISSPRGEKPKGTDFFSTKYTASHRCRRCEIGRIEELFSAPCRRPSTPPWSPPEWCVSSLPWTTGP